MQIAAQVWSYAFVELRFNIIVNSPIYQPSQQPWYNLVHTVFPASYVYVSIWFLNYLMQRQIEGKLKNEKVKENIYFQAL